MGARVLLSGTFTFIAAAAGEVVLRVNPSWQCSLLLAPHPPQRWHGGENREGGSEKSHGLR